ncbi:hypothetical protein C0V72_14240 [Porphyrobacter sp. TH134]|uniref:hypothetical protein n=1 Tax=Porphyrobacter sp. TH134 TaxID=2067450 RepID=UPI000C7AB871|nr:hypothetical protein [Porphyrobacter sp. TH134]PLK22545.1 hypothetical protein C0V72_14240 [Porphyrobacter sp. TH134]
MKFNKIAAGIAAASLVAAPVVAQSAFAPAIAPLTGDENGAEGSNGIIIGVVAAAGVIGGIILIADVDEPNLPVSG